MKKVFLSMLILISAKVLQAQNDYTNSDNSESKGFKKENVFLGGSLSLGFSSGSFGVGANPEIGYSVAQWLDAGIVFNINYFSQTYYNYSGTSNDVKASSFNYGSGVFARAYPLPFLFVQLQPEENWISNHYKNFGIPNATNSATSFIGALGYGQRIVGQGSYFFMIGLDLLNNANSPYQDGYGHAQPIIRGGFDVYLHASKKSSPSGPQL